MLMYLTSWEESLVPGLRKHSDSKNPLPKIRCCWKGYDFDVLNELTDTGLVNARGRAKSASFTEDGELAVKKLLKQYGLDIE